MRLIARINVFRVGITSEVNLFAGDKLCRWSCWGGGNFGHLAEFSAAAMIGGTASRIAGGRFESGAVIGFFSRAFNHALHEAIANTYSNIKNWFRSPKTYQLGFENTQTIGGGYTTEWGVYFYQKGWTIDYGTYDSKGGIWVR